MAKNVSDGVDGQDELIKKVQAGKHARTRLKTDQRVLARITDGIYREPASALRELLYNAYDADAKQVVITTDAPRFSEIVVSDDGNGMTIDVLNHILHHIGGSAKRTQDGQRLHITDPKRSRFSPKGRQLIGKIGIGLFAVAQLTRHFQIVTKTKGSSERYFADIILKTYSEDDLADVAVGAPKQFDTGDVEVWKEPARDKEAHGTQIILLDLKQYAKDLLQSRDRWILQDPENRLVDEEYNWTPPAYHIGSLSTKDPTTVKNDARLPWDEAEDDPLTKFRNFYQAVLDETGETNSIPELKNALDNYLRTLWTLALSVPLEYVEKHPFDLTGDDGVRVFQLSNRDKGSAEEIKLKPNQTIREATNVTSTSPDDFKVFVDSVQLLRPIRFTRLPTKSKAKFKTPLMFLGSCNPDMSKFPKETVGGRQLSFEGYFFWVPTIVPKENNGIILRLGNASGKLFDDGFLRYEVSEQTRLRQITAELFFSEGLDAALNIDRESFNESHPHYQFTSKWVHRALRQLATRHKALGAELNAAARAETGKKARSKIRKVVVEALKNSPVGGENAPADVEFVDDDKSMSAKDQRKQGVLVFPKTVLKAEKGKPAKKGANQKRQASTLEDRMKAVAQVLNAYGLLEGLSYPQQTAILHAIVRIFSTEGEA